VGTHATLVAGNVMHSILLPLWRDALMYVEFGRPRNHVPTTRGKARSAQFANKPPIIYRGALQVGVT
jgi:hypothetical protein